MTDDRMFPSGGRWMATCLLQNCREGSGTSRSADRQGVVARGLQFWGQGWSCGGGAHRIFQRADDGLAMVVGWVGDGRGVDGDDDPSSSSRCGGGGGVAAGSSSLLRWVWFEETPKEWCLTLVWFRMDPSTGFGSFPGGICISNRHTELNLHLHDFTTTRHHRRSIPIAVLYLASRTLDWIDPHALFFFPTRLLTCNTTTPTGEATLSTIT